MFPFIKNMISSNYFFLHSNATFSEFPTDQFQLIQSTPKVNMEHLKDLIRIMFIRNVSGLVSQIRLKDILCVFILGIFFIIKIFIIKIIFELLKSCKVDNFQDSNFRLHITSLQLWPQIKNDP